MATNILSDEPKGLEDKVTAELNDVYRKKGVDGLLNKVRKNLDKWKSVPLDIAVTGVSGAGKSSYINAVLGLNANDEGAAAVDVVETTKECKSYQHPEYSNFLLWDLPGIGTARFPREEYVEKVDFKKYDFFLIFSSSRFTENDMWLAEQVKLLGKSFYFIRTKIDVDISNDKMAHPRTHSEESVKDRIREHTLLQLQHFDNHDEILFLINNYNKDEFEFEALALRLIKDAPSIKKEALALSFNSLTEGIIKEKAKYLKKRIYIISVASAIAGAVPVPGVGTAVDIVILLEEVIFYRRQLHLDDASLLSDATVLNVSLEFLKKTLKLSTSVLKSTPESLLAYLSRLGISNITENALKFAIPLVGSLLAAGVSYGTQVYCLRSLLGDMVKDAISRNKQVARMMTEIIDG